MQQHYLELIFEWALQSFRGVSSNYVYAWTCWSNLVHTAINFHHFLTVSLRAQNLSFQKVLSSTLVCFCRRFDLMALDRLLDSYANRFSCFRSVFFCFSYPSNASRLSWPAFWSTLWRTLIYWAATVFSYRYSSSFRVTGFSLRHISYCVRDWQMCHYIALCRWPVTRNQESEVRLSQILTCDRSSFCIQRYYGAVCISVCSTSSVTMSTYGTNICFRHRRIEEMMIERGM